MRPNRPPLPPLDAASLDRLALRYVERFATTRKRLADYLDRKVRARGWQAGAGDADEGLSPAPDTAAVAERLAGLGYIDDRAFGEARGRAMARRGLGERRVAAALHHAGVTGEDDAAIRPAIAARALEAALAFARRRRIGPYADQPADRDQSRRQLAAMIRGGHDFALARRIVSMAPGDDVSVLDDPSQSG